MTRMQTADALQWLAAVLDADGRDPVTLDRMTATLILSELHDLRTALWETMDEARGARHMLAEWLAEQVEGEDA